MLQFNPHFRPTANELLKDKMFDKIRQEELEELPAFKIVMDEEDKDT